MGDVRLTPQDFKTAGEAVTRTAIAAGNNYQVRVPPGGVVLNWRKTGAGAATITIVTPNTVDGLAIAERTVTVAATTGDMWGLYRREDYANASGDLVFSTNEGTGLTCAVGQGIG